MKQKIIYITLFLSIPILLTLSCKKDPVQTPEEYVQDKPHDANLVGFWMGFADAEIKTIGGKLTVIISDTATIYPGISEYQSTGADFSYSLKKENGHYIHSYDPASKGSENYWYSGTSGSELVVYDVYAIGDSPPSSYVAFDYKVYNTDTLITTDYNTAETRVIVRLADPSQIPTNLKIKE